MLPFVRIFALIAPTVLGQPQCLTLNNNQRGSLACPEGQVVTEVVFASYGRPSGRCPRFEQDDACHAASSQARVEERCLGANHCALVASPEVFTDDNGCGEQLSVQLTCANPTQANPMPVTCQEVMWDENNVAGRVGPNRQPSGPVEFLGDVSTYQECQSLCNDHQTCQTWTYRTTYHQNEEWRGQCHAVTDVSMDISDDVNSVSGLCCKGAMPDIENGVCTFQCTPGCGEHGRCTGPNMCSCDDGWTGATCNEEQCQCVSWGDTHLIPSCGGDRFDWMPLGCYTTGLLCNENDNGGWEIQESHYTCNPARPQVTCSQTLTLISPNGMTLSVNKDNQGFIYINEDRISRDTQTWPFQWEGLTISEGNWGNECPWCAVRDENGVSRSGRELIMRKETGCRFTVQFGFNYWSRPDVINLNVDMSSDDGANDITNPPLADQNQPNYWEEFHTSSTGNALECVKPTSECGSGGCVSQDGQAGGTNCVVAQPGWDFLVLKAGTENFIMENVIAGHIYCTGGRGRDISHIIFCTDTGAEQPAPPRPRTLCGGGPTPNQDDAGDQSCRVPPGIRGPLGPTNNGFGGVPERYSQVGDMQGHDGVPTNPANGLAPEEVAGAMMEAGVDNNIAEMLQQAGIVGQDLLDLTEGQLQQAGITDPADIAQVMGVAKVQTNQVPTMTEEEVAQWLIGMGVPENEAELVQGMNIDGQHLFDVTEAELVAGGVSPDVAREIIGAAAEATKWPEEFTAAEVQGIMMLAGVPKQDAEFMAAAGIDGTKLGTLTQAELIAAGVSPDATKEIFAAAGTVFNKNKNPLVDGELAPPSGMLDAPGVKDLLMAGGVSEPSAELLRGRGIDGEKLAELTAADLTAAGITDPKEAELILGTAKEATGHQYLMTPDEVEAFFTQAGVPQNVAAQMASGTQPVNGQSLDDLYNPAGSPSPGSPSDYLISSGVTNPADQTMVLSVAKEMTGDILLMTPKEVEQMMIRSGVSPDAAASLVAAGVSGADLTTLTKADIAAAGVPAGNEEDTLKILGTAHGKTTDMGLLDNEMFAGLMMTEGLSLEDAKKMIEKQMHGKQVGYMETPQQLAVLAGISADGAETVFQAVRAMNPTGATPAHYCPGKMLPEAKTCCTAVPEFVWGQCMIDTCNNWMPGKAMACTDVVHLNYLATFAGACPLGKTGQGCVYCDEGFWGPDCDKFCDQASCPGAAECNMDGMCQNADGTVTTPAPRCDDNMMNGQETGIDCGPACQNKQCQPSCFNKIQDGLEEGVDCGGKCEHACDKSATAGTPSDNAGSNGSNNNVPTGNGFINGQAPGPILNGPSPAYDAFMGAHSPSMPQAGYGTPVQEEKHNEFSAGGVAEPWENEHNSLDLDPTDNATSRTTCADGGPCGEFSVTDSDGRPAGTCTDNIWSQGEDGIDCGGDCSSCHMFLKTLAVPDDKYTESTFQKQLADAVGVSAVTKDDIMIKSKADFNGGSHYEEITFSVNAKKQIHDDFEAAYGKALEAPDGKLLKEFNLGELCTDMKQDGAEQGLDCGKACDHQPCVSGKDLDLTASFTVDTEAPDVAKLKTDLKHLAKIACDSCVRVVVQNVDGHATVETYLDNASEGASQAFVDAVKTRDTEQKIELGEAHCEDRKKNYDEEGIDCGKTCTGGTAPPCEEAGALFVKTSKDVASLRQAFADQLDIPTKDVSVQPSGSSVKVTITPDVAPEIKKDFKKLADGAPKSGSPLSKVYDDVQGIDYSADGTDPNADDDGLHNTHVEWWVIVLAILGVLLVFAAALLGLVVLFKRNAKSKDSVSDEEEELNPKDMDEDDEEGDVDLSEQEPDAP